MNPKSRAYLAVEGLSKTFTGGKRPVHALDGVSLSVEEGEIACIVGKSGCGKSTLLRAIAGLETAYEGSISLDGKPILGPGRDRGVVFQEHRLLPWLTVEQNVAFALQSLSASETRRRVLKYLKKVGLSRNGRRYPHQLSGGMAQRVAIARALVNKPGVLLLDEPFGALDALTKLQMQEEILRIWKAEKTTTVLVTHDIDEAVYLGSQVIVMGSAPKSVKKRFEIDLDYPRDRNNPSFAAIRKEILKELL